MDAHPAVGPTPTTSRADTPARRRRRSVSPLPPHPSPADVPEDAPGRVAFVAMSVAPDIVPATTAPALHEASPTSAPASAAPFGARLDGPLGAWLPVAILGAAMLVVFIIGMVVTR